MHGRDPKAFKESEVTRIHDLVFVKKGSANTKIQVGERSHHDGVGRWLQSENIHQRGQG
jgi:hypothetical protein